MLCTDLNYSLTSYKVVMTKQVVTGFGIFLRVVTVAEWHAECDLRLIITLIF